MGKLVMPKNSALLEEIEPALQIYYEANGWLENKIYKRKLKSIIGDDQYASSYTKKMQILSYFGFTEWEDIKSTQSKRRITKNGRDFYDALKENDQNKINESIMCSLENTIFGRKNFGCPESDTDFEAPCAFIRAILDLDYLTYKEFSYLAYNIVDKGGSYTDLIRCIKDSRNDGIETPDEAKKYEDCKPIMVLVRWGFLFEENNYTPKRIKISGDVLKKYKDRLLNLKIYNIDKNVELKNSSLTLLRANRKSGGYNKIYYGIPGCGKSHAIEEDIAKEYGNDLRMKDNVFRTTFFLDYTNTDFIGQLVPGVDLNGDITYIPKLGPFSKALKRSFETDDMVYLVIEELNRGNASAIFGDLFQLLDRIDEKMAKSRNDGSKEGDSEYPISNAFLEDSLHIPEGQVIIPSNMTILATMNTSDQNVFVLDTAFQRRWKKHKVNDSAKGSVYEKYYVPNSMGEEIKWGDFLEEVNTYMMLSDDSITSEDKQIGPYFVTDSILVKKVEDIKNEERIEDFNHKVIEYLWNDVTKFERERWFKSKKDSHTPKSFDNLIRLIEKYGISSTIKPIEQDKNSEKD